jgi:hypothetical protein
MWDTRIGLVGDRNQSEEKILDEGIAIPGLSDEAAISLPWPYIEKIALDYGPDMLMIPLLFLTRYVTSSISP